MHIVLLSDTHSYLDEKIIRWCALADEIWHAGDIGHEKVLDQLESLKKPLRVVYGNIDAAEIRLRTQENLIFEVNGLRVFMTHIGGRPNAYPARISQVIRDEKIGLFICGHSHICLAGRNERLGNLHLNPGAAGVHGFHKVRTLMSFDVVSGKVENLQVVELGPRATSQL
jgi:putative phosphoesterase